MINFCSIQIPPNSAGLIEYRAHPFWLQKYCPSHERDGTPRCCSCQRLEVSYIRSQIFFIIFCYQQADTDVSHLSLLSLFLSFSFPYETFRSFQSVDTKYLLLDDGRKLCLECLDSAIMDTHECQPLYVEIQEFYEGLHMKIEQQVPMLLVERQALNEAMEGEKNVNVNVFNFHSMFCLLFLFFTSYPFHCSNFALLLNVGSSSLT